MVARKLVYEIVARYGAFRELRSDLGTNFGSKGVGGVSTVQNTQDKDYTLPPPERRVHRTKLQDSGWDELGTSLCPSS